MPSDTSRFGYKLMMSNKVRTEFLSNVVTFNILLKDHMVNSIHTQTFGYLTVCMDQGVCRSNR